MALSVLELENILKERPGSQKLSELISYEDRLRMHADISLDEVAAGNALTEFLDWVNTMLPKDKFVGFCKVLKFPLKTNGIVDDIFRELDRVFDAKNASNGYVFKGRDQEEDWDWYRTEVLKEPNIWRTKGMRNLKSMVNSFIVVDMPSKPSKGAKLPEPYFYWLDVRNVFSYEVDADGKVQWLLSVLDDTHMAVFDDTSYRVIEITSAYELVGVVKEAPHRLGYCPVSYFWQNPVSVGDPNIKMSPITKELANLDWYLFYETSKRYLDTYAAYPIYSSYETDCNYRESTPDGGECRCKGGIIYDSLGRVVMTANGVMTCPACSNKRLVGPGSFIEIPVPSTVEGTADLRNPVQITSIDRSSLDYNTGECDRLRNEIFASCTGSAGVDQSKEAVNETQVSATFDSKTSVLRSLKTNFEAIQKFVDDTCARLRYGDAFIESSINWGTEFYIYSLDELYRKYELAKLTGASESQLMTMQAEIISTENKNNPLQLSRINFLQQIEPYVGLSRKEVVEMAASNILEPDLVRIKFNFHTFVDRFERENGNIVEFGANLPFKTRVASIIQTFKAYLTNGKEPIELQSRTVGGESGSRFDPTGKPLLPENGEGGKPANRS